MCRVLAEALTTKQQELDATQTHLARAERELQERTSAAQQEQQAQELHLQARIEEVRVRVCGWLGWLFDFACFACFMVCTRVLLLLLLLLCLCVTVSGLIVWLCVSLCLKHSSSG
jgi:hypothetical protein